jgi:hypothetical protein
MDAAKTKRATKAPGFIKQKAFYDAKYRQITPDIP